MSNNSKIMSLEDDEIICTDSEVAETFNSFSLMSLNSRIFEDYETY